MTTVIKESRTKGDAPMKRLVQFAALATAIASGIHVAAAAELPNFVSAGFPINRAPGFHKPSVPKQLLLDHPAESSFRNRHPFFGALRCQS
jgi:hypothetical protein